MKMAQLPPLKMYPFTLGLHFFKNNNLCDFQLLPCVINSSKQESTFKGKNLLLLKQILSFKS